MELGQVLSKEGYVRIKNAEIDDLVNAINSCDNWCDCRYECEELIERARDAGAELPDDYEDSIYEAADFFGFELD